jgi:branched-chain amino acid transport system substrate-binding protein
MQRRQLWKLAALAAWLPLVTLACGDDDDGGGASDTSAATTAGTAATTAAATTTTGEESATTAAGTTSADTTEASNLPATIKIGVPLDTSGSAGIAGVGTNEYEGIKLALEEIESTGFLGDTEIELVFADTKADLQEAVAAVTKMVPQDQVDAIVGFSLTPSFMAAAPIAQEAGIPIIAVGLSPPGVTDVGDFVFRIIPDVTKIYPPQDKLFAETFGAQRAAYLYNNDTETVVNIQKARQSGLEAAGLETAIVQTLTANDTDLRAQLTEIGNSDADIFILSTFPGQYASAYLQAQELGLDMQIVAADGTAGAQILDQAADAMQCVVWTAVWSAQNQEGRNQHFQELLDEKLGKPGDLFYAAGYDGLWVYATAVRDAGSAEPEAVRQALNDLEDFEGAFGVYDFDENRNPSITGTNLQIQDGTPTLWEPGTECTK